MTEARPLPTSSHLARPVLLSDIVLSTATQYSNLTLANMYLLDGERPRRAARQPPRPLVVRQARPFASIASSPSACLLGQRGPLVVVVVVVVVVAVVVAVVVVVA